jgi:hypothetical protein
MNIRLWLQRYGPAEIAGLAGTFGGFYVALAFTSNPVVSAYSGTVGENIGFYGLIIIREMRTDIRSAHQAGKTYGLQGMAATIAHLGFEFGVAESADALVIRPLSLGFATRNLGNIYGLFVGKIAADVVFYVIAMFFHSLRHKQV